MSNPIDTDAIGIIMLAAGAGNRFGSDKRQARMANGLTLLENTLANVPPDLTRRILVLKTGDDDLAADVPGNWHLCQAGSPETGMANSLASGIALADSDGWQGALIALADMPWVTPAVYSSLQVALSEHDIVVPMYKGKRGNPVGFRQRFFAEMKTLSGDHGAKSLLQQYATACHTCEINDDGILRDVDTPDGII